MAIIGIRCDFGLTMNRNTLWCLCDRRISLLILLRGALHGPGNRHLKSFQQSSHQQELPVISLSLREISIVYMCGRSCLLILLREAPRGRQCRHGESFEQCLHQQELPVRSLSLSEMLIICSVECVFTLIFVKST